MLKAFELTLCALIFAIMATLTVWYQVGVSEMQTAETSLHYGAPR